MVADGQAPIWSVDKRIKDYIKRSWWRHQMEIFSALLVMYAGIFTGHRGIPRTQRPVTRGFDVFFDLRLNEWLSKQSWGWWIETPWRPLLHHSSVAEKA